MVDGLLFWGFVLFCMEWHCSSLMVTRVSRAVVSSELFQKRQIFHDKREKVQDHQFSSVPVRKGDQSSSSIFSQVKLA